MDRIKRIHISKLIFALVALVVVYGCDQDKVALGDFTGNEITYQLFATSDYNNEGTLTFKEKNDHSLLVEVYISNTQERGLHPLHMHYGPLSQDGDLAINLSPIDGKSGKSTTQLMVLGDETKFTFNDLLEFDGSVKIHLDDGPFKDVILSATNIGINKQGDFNIKSCTDFSVDP